MSSHVAEDFFLDLVKKTETKVKIGIQTLPDTIFLEGLIYEYDDDAILLEMPDKGARTLIYKRFIATIST